ncbi:2-oxoglutarate-dependent dioxygenase 19-like [Aristolochia californica]|uniref:2-oxoglutarate-dependent dioxygenase 19-like n=1 Tax=Aristolochia californica TaxID=171875 RepID=UPI0035D96E3A
MQFSRRFITSLSQFYTNVSHDKEPPPPPGDSFPTPVASPMDSIPIIDLSLISSGSLHQRFQTMQDLDKACRQWGLFLVINHGVPEKLRNAMVKACHEISDPLEKERMALAGNVEEKLPKACFINAAAPAERIFFKKDLTKILLRVNFFGPPTKPLSSFSEVSVEYCKSIKRLATDLVRLISETECIKDGWYNKMLRKETRNGGYHILEANFYPPRPAETQLAVGQPEHSNMGLLTVLLQNDVGWVEVLHNNKWVLVNPLPNSFLVIVGDHLEMASDGRCKRKPYRSVNADQRTRISVSVDHGRNTFVSVDKKWLSKSTTQQTARLNMETLCNFMKSDQFHGQCGFNLVRRGVGKLTHTIRLICFKCGVHLGGDSTN